MSNLSPGTPDPNHLPLSSAEKAQLEKFAQDVKTIGITTFNQDKKMEDYLGLRQDIVQFLSENNPGKIEEFNEFARLLDVVANLITPEYAYACGKAAKKAGKDHTTALHEFRMHMSKITFESKESKKYDIMMDTISDALMPAYSLIDEYFELHAVLSVLTNPSELFFTRGYKGVRKPLL